MTTIELREAAIGSGLAADLPATTLVIEPGSPTIIVAETAERPMLLSLVIGGRLALTSGSALIDGRPDAAALRAATALVDTPFVAEPTPGITLALVVAEELSFAGRPSGAKSVAAWLQGHGLSFLSQVPMRSIPATERVLLLTELALLREGVTAIVVTSPERHGGDPAEWYPQLEAISQRGISVAIITDSPTARLLETLDQEK